MKTFELTTRLKAFSRKQGHNAVAAAAYRTGVKLHCDRSNKTHDYRNRSADVVISDIVFPSGSPRIDRNALWNAVESRETRKVSRTARELLIALPEALRASERHSVIKRISEHLTERHGVVVDYAIHAPPKDGDQRNHHAHLLFTTRRMENGILTEKTRELDDKATGPMILKEWRQLIAQLFNEALERQEAANTVFVEHQSFAERGIDRSPQKHHGNPSRYKRLHKLKLAFQNAVNFTKGAFIHRWQYVRPMELKR